MEKYNNQKNKNLSEWAQQQNGEAREISESKDKITEITQWNNRDKIDRKM